MLSAPPGRHCHYLEEQTLPRTRGHAVCATLGVGALVFAVIHSADASWTSPVTAAALAAGLTLLAVLVTAERRAAQPIMPLRLFGGRAATRD